MSIKTTSRKNLFTQILWGICLWLWITKGTPKNAGEGRCAGKGSGVKTRKGKIKEKKTGLKNTVPPTERRGVLGGGWGDRVLLLRTVSSEKAKGVRGDNIEKRWVGGEKGDREKMT